MSSSPSPEPPQNPNSQWQFTWEAQSQIPLIRLTLYNRDTRPSAECVHLNVDLRIPQSLLIVTFSHTAYSDGNDVETSLRVPLPKVLIDPESPVHYRIFDDHIEVKLGLLLPVDNPLVSDLGSLLNSSVKDEVEPFSVCTDVKKLSAMEEVYFYCRSCSTKLTRALRSFEEMPSVNWQESADNWFGNCCCSFGGISEKMVTRYAKSYACATGSCLVDTMSVTLCKDDLVGCKFSDVNSANRCEKGLCSSNHRDEVQFPVSRSDVYEDKLAAESERLCIDNVDNDFDSLTSTSLASEIADDMASLPGAHADVDSQVAECPPHCCARPSKILSEEPNPGLDAELLATQKIFRNGYLGNGFIAKSSSCSKDVRWVDFSCPQCSRLLGAYPCLKDDDPLDNGIRLFKCYISTSLPVGGFNDLFRNYTLEMMFTTQLLENAKDELSFRSVIRDMQTKSPMLQIVLLNPNLWFTSGCCLPTTEPAVKVDLYPTIKVLFSACRKHDDCESRMLEEWARRNQVDELHMLASQVKELITTLELANSHFPPSHSLVEGLFLSFLRR